MGLRLGRKKKGGAPAGAGEKGNLQGYPFSPFLPAGMIYKNL